MTACLKIDPADWSFAATEIKTFTVTNLGPGQSHPLQETVVGTTDPDASLLFLLNNGPGANTFNPDDCRDFHKNGLAVGDKCTVKMLSVHTPGDGHEGFLLVGADNTQIHTATGQRGVAAHVN